MASRSARSVAAMTARTHACTQAGRHAHDMTISMFKYNIDKYITRADYTHMTNGRSISHCHPCPLAIWVFAFDRHQYPLKNISHHSIPQAQHLVLTRRIVCPCPPTPRTKSVPSYLQNQVRALLPPEPSPCPPTPRTKSVPSYPQNQVRALLPPEPSPCSPTPRTKSVPSYPQNQVRALLPPEPSPCPPTSRTKSVPSCPQNQVRALLPPEPSPCPPAPRSKLRSDLCGARL